MDGFETHVTAAIHAKDVPVQVVADKDKADYDLAGTSDTKTRLDKDHLSWTGEDR